MQFKHKLIFEYDNPALDVFFYNLPEDSFEPNIIAAITPEQIRQHLKESGIEDEQVFQKAFQKFVFDEIERQITQPPDPRSIAIHREYKRLMRKAINKEPFIDGDLASLETFFTEQRNIRITAESSKLKVEENPVSIILQRLGKGIVDVANSDKDIRLCAASDCDVAFVPVRKDQKYHGKTCGNRMRQRIARAKKM